jgi:PAS domain S-box-containing protein
MDIRIILGLLQNIAILMAFSMIYDYSWVRSDTESKTLLKKIVTGIVVGGIAIILMLSPWKLIPGLVFDTRSILLSLTGLFMGFLPTMIAVIIAAFYRISMGGPGLWMGLAVIITSGAIGVLWGKLRPAWRGKKYILELAFFGIIVHLLMLVCSLLLPPDQIKSTLNYILFPLLTIYPAGTVLLGMLMAGQYINWQNRKASEKLQQSEQRFAGMLKNTLLFSLIIDTNGKLIYSNDPFLKVVGFSPEEVTGKDIFETFVPDDSKNAVKDAFSYILTGNTGFYNFESEILTKDHERLVVSWNLTVIKDEKNVALSVVCIGENITIRKKAETELLKAKIRAEESDNLKSIFLTNMSHEIRTPMNAIMGFSNLLGDKDVSEDEKGQYIEIIKNASDRLLKIINDIIDVSKIEAKQLSINFAECDINKIFSNSTESFRKSDLFLYKSGIELILSIPGKNEGIKFISDPHRFQQVLDNLLSNAIKYTEKGKIETGYNLISENGSKRIEVFVSDTGIGIPEEKHDLIFERFRQVEEGRFHEGAGLGLSISKGIMDLLGGRIWFTSQPGKGTTFYFSVPFVSPERIKTEEVGSELPDINLVGKTVIVAEDDYNSYFYLRLLLEELHANILYAENGYVLMNLIRHKVPDLILLDINMPVMSGFDCLQKIREENIKTRIIAQTAYAMPEEKARCIAEGCHGYISKPFSKAELQKIINSVLFQINSH